MNEMLQKLGGFTPRDFLRGCLEHSAVASQDPRLLASGVLMQAVEGTGHRAHPIVPHQLRHRETMWHDELSTSVSCSFALSSRIKTTNR